MSSQVYFDEDALRKGDFYNLKSDISTEHNKKYEIVEWVARGGNATIFKCYDVITGEEFAIKVLMHLSNKSRKRFFREIRLLQSYSDRHLIKYYGSGVIKAQHNHMKRIVRLPFLVMELADKNLLELVKKSSISYEQYSGQFRGLARALSKLHKHAIHRDIKPENILVAGDRWLLSDFGLCSLVTPDEDDVIHDGNKIGPKYWLSPEAHNRSLGGNDNISLSSDVFQLASVFWFVATGRHPCGVITEKDWVGPQKLYKVLHGALLHNASSRPQDGSELASCLEEALAE